MTAKQKAIMDMKQEFHASGKCFLAFRTELNPIMDKIVNSYIKAQQQCANSIKKI